MHVEGIESSRIHKFACAKATDTNSPLSGWKLGKQFFSQVSIRKIPPAALQVRSIDLMLQ